MIEMWWSRSAEVVGTLMCHPDPPPLPPTHRFPSRKEALVSSAVGSYGKMILICRPSLMIILD